MKHRVMDKAAYERGVEDSRRIKVRAARIKKSKHSDNALAKRSGSSMHNMPARKKLKY